MANRAADMPKMLEILSDANIDPRTGPEHRRHFQFARQALEKATDAWWEQHEGQYFGHQMVVAFDETWNIARCTDACGSSPRNRA